MGFGVLFGLLMIASGWWLYSRWSALRDAQAQRREAEMMMVFESRSQRTPPKDHAEGIAGARSAIGDFQETFPGRR